MFKQLWPIVFALGLSGCASLGDLSDSIKGNVNQKSDTAKLYKWRAEMKMTVEGKTYNGIGIAPLRNVNRITIVSSVPLDRLQVHTCARDDVFRDIDENWFGGAGKKFTYEYVPNEKEKQVPCFLYFEAYSNRGLTDWGMIAFIDGQELHASMDCNGRNVPFEGLSACQTQAGLDQVIYFNEEIVDYEADPWCGLLKLSPTKFALRPKPGFCKATMMNEKDKMHRMLLLGYEAVLVRSD